MPLANYFQLSSRDKAILTGLYLAKFDEAGLARLGFGHFQTAYNVFGLALGVVPKSIQNYRDEFDPVFPNPRVGRLRPMRLHCQQILAQFGNLLLDEFVEVIRQLIYQDLALEQLREATQVAEEATDSGVASDASAAFARRLMTGAAAEQYFQDHYPAMTEFDQQPLVNTTMWGCGFDFRVGTGTNFLGVEVKGLSERSGRISLTEKEYRVAQLLGDRYFLFIVKNFRAKPFHELIQNPLASRLRFAATSIQITSTTWQAAV